MPTQEFYHDDEAERILAEAVRLTGVVEKTVSREQLMATAAELGISDEALRQAEQNLLQRTADISRQQEELILQRQFATEVRRRHAVQWSGWLSTSLICIFVNLMTAGWQLSGLGWCWWVVGIYGAICLKDFVVLVLTQPEKDEAGFKRWVARRRMIEDRIAAVGLNLDTLDAFLETRLEAGVDEAADLATSLGNTYGLNADDSKLAVLTFAQRNPQLISRYGVDIDM